jgi:hypothetical protein
MYFHCKIFIHEKCLQNKNGKFQKSASRLNIIDARAHYWAAARRLRSPGLVVRVPGYRSRDSGSIPGTTRFSRFSGK